MKEITKLMVKKYELMKLGYDFMGYDIINKNNLRNSPFFLHLFSLLCFSALLSYLFTYTILLFCKSELILPQFTALYLKYNLAID